MKKLLLQFLLLLFPLTHSEAQHMSIANYTTKEGLSENFVNSIFRDSFGYLWIGTSYGLNRFDGYSFEHFYSSTLNNQAICSNFVNHIVEDDKHNIWISTDEGICVFDYNTQKITTIKMPNHMSCFVQKTLHKGHFLYAATDRGIIVYDKRNKSSYILNIGSLRNERIHDIAIDRNNHLWFTYQEYAIKYNLKNGKSKSYKTERNRLYLNDELQLNLTTDISGNIWLTTSNGLLKYNPEQDAFTKEVNTEGNISIAIHDSIIWIAGWDSGLVKYNLNTRETLFMSKHKNPEQDIDFNSLVCATVDKDNILWVGGVKGVTKCILQNETTHFWSISSPTQYNSPHEIPPLVKGILTDHDKNLWIGTENGIKKITVDKQEESYYSVGNIPQEKLNNQVLSLCEDDNGTIWAGTMSGLNILDKRKKEYGYFSNKKEDNYLKSNQIWNMQKDAKGIIWIGTRMGLFRFNPNNKKFTSYFTNQKDTNSINDNRISSILPVNENIVYAGTKKGIAQINVKDGTIKRFVHEENNPNSLISNSVNQIIQDNKGRIWVLSDLGLQEFIPAKWCFRCFAPLKEKRLLQAAIDKNGFLWILSQNDMYIYNPEQNKLLSSSYIAEIKKRNISSISRDNAGCIYLGVENGVFSVDPKKLSDSIAVPPVILQSFVLFNKPLIPGEEDSPLATNINQTKEIKLNYKQNFFSIDFVAIDFVTPSQLIYSYKLEGFDKEWIVAENRKTAYYTKVPPGKYTFRVKAMSNDGQSTGPEKTLQIIITPPFYNTVYAYLAYVLIIVLILYFFRRYTIIQVIEKSKLEQSMLEQKKEKEIYNAKIQFFMNISHEFRTPLTLILGPLQQLLSSETDCHRKATLSSISKNTNRLLLLINQLLEFRKTETGTLQLKASENDIVTCCREIVNTFDDIARQKGINLIFKPETEHYPVWFDLDMFEKIMFNLLTNALKYTLQDGEVTVYIRKGYQQETIVKKKFGIFKESITNQIDAITVTVKDTGIGIPKDKLNNIFDRFYQIQSLKTEGTGIGLSLVKNLVLLHHGKITVDSEPGKGSEFTFSLPLGNNHLMKEQLVNQTIEKYVVQMNPDDMLSSGDISTGNNPIEISPDSDKPLILVVDDNKEIIMYIKNSLQLKFEVISAKNGEEGLKKAIRSIPNIILCDINMPVMDGIELTKRIKGNELTNHIPVILLTAYTSEESQIDAYSYGADDFITKPFNIKLLEIKMENILNREREIRKKFKQEAIYDNVLEDNTQNISNDTFLSTLNKFINDNITNPELDVDLIAKELYISRSQLYRKVSALSGFSVKEYVKLYRLSVAESLLHKKDIRIAEVMDSTGFNNRSYFVNSFKKIYGMTPSEYRENKTKGTAPEEQHPH